MQLVTVFPKPPIKSGLNTPFPVGEQRCVANRRCRRHPDGSKVQCRNYRTPRSAKGYCAFHMRKYERYGRGGSTVGQRTEEAPKYGAAYSVHLSQTLTSRLAELAGKSPIELIDLTEELKLAKSTVDDVASFYDVALLAQEQADTPEKQLACLQASIAAGRMVRDVIAEVGDIAGKAAGAMAAAKAFVGVQDLPLLVGQIVEAVHDELGDDDPELVKRIAGRIRDIKLPSSGPHGTDITPDQDVLEMDDTIPRVA